MEEQTHCDECGRKLTGSLGNRYCPGEWDGFGNGGGHSPGLTTSMRRRRAMTKATQAQRRESAAKRKLKQQRDDTNQHIQNLDRQAQQLQQQATQIQQVRSEMLGRLRYICEELGEVEPLPAAEVPEEPVPEDE